MSIATYFKNMNYIRNFASKLKREEIPDSMQKIFIKVYAKDLKINLTNNMIVEILKLH
jgi:hypothetical protein